MNALTLRPSAVPDRASGNISLVREEPRLAESVYRTVSALRADPRLADEALPPDAYLAAVDSVVAAHDAARDAERHLDEFPQRIEPSRHKEPQS